MAIQLPRSHRGRSNLRVLAFSAILSLGPSSGWGSDSPPVRLDPPSLSYDLGGDRDEPEGVLTGDPLRLLRGVIRLSASETVARLPQDSSLAYAWSQETGPDVVLTDADSLSATFQAPDVARTDSLGFAFRVTLSIPGLDSIQVVERVSIRIRDVEGVPSAVASGPRRLQPGYRGRLSSGDSRNAVGGVEDLELSWTQVVGPGSPLALSDSDPLKVEIDSQGYFFAPVREERLHFMLTALDRLTGRSAQAWVQVPVHWGLSAPLLRYPSRVDVSERSPVSVQVRVEPSGRDDSGDLTYRWKQLDHAQGSPLVEGDPRLVALDSPSGDVPDSLAVPLSFAAPETGTEDSLFFLLEVSLVDALRGRTGTLARVEVRVRDVDVPVADAGTGFSAFEGETVSLDGSASADPDGVALTGTWVSEPALPGGALSGLSPSWTLPEASGPGAVDSYWMTLTVRDPQGHTDSDRVLVLVKDRDGVPDAVAAHTVLEAAAGDLVVLDGSGSRSAAGSASGLNYRWTAPDGVVLGNARAAVATFDMPSGEGPLDFTLTVEDWTTEQTDSVQVQVLRMAAGTIRVSGGVAEVEEGGSVSWTLRGHGLSQGATSLQWTASSTSMASVDFCDEGGVALGAMPSGTLRFSSAEPEHTLSLRVCADMGVETGESFTLTLTRPADSPGPAPELGDSVMAVSVRDLGIRAVRFARLDSGDLSEAGGTAWFQVSLASGVVSQAVSVPLDLQNPAAPGSDWNPASSADWRVSASSVEIAAGSSSVSFWVESVPDLVFEGREVFTVDLGALPAGLARHPDSAGAVEVGIADAQRLLLSVSLADSDRHIQEDDQTRSKRRARFIFVARGAELSAPVDVAYEVRGCGPFGDLDRSDCVFPASPVRIAPVPGSTLASASIFVEAVSDRVNEATGDVSVHLLGGRFGGAMVPVDPGRKDAYIGLRDNDPVSVDLERFSPYGALAEGSLLHIAVRAWRAELSGPLDFRLKLSGISASDIEFEAPASLAGMSQLDVPLTIHPAPGETDVRMSVKIRIRQDGEPEGAEALVVRLADFSTGMHGAVNPASPMTVALAADPPLAVSMGIPVSRGQRGEAPARTIRIQEGDVVELPVFLQRLDGGPILVGFSISPAGPDFSVLTPSPLLIPEGESSHVILLQAVHDGAAEADEAFTVRLTSVGGSPSGASLTADASTVTIAADSNHAHLISLSADRIQAREGDTVSFTVSRLGPDIAAGRSLRMAWVFDPLSSTADDFAGGVLPAGGSFTFMGSVRSHSFTVEVGDDDLSDSDSFAFRLLSPGAAPSQPQGGFRISHSEARVEILDDDVVQVQLSDLTPVRIREGSSHTIEVSLTGTAENPVRVPFRFHHEHTVASDWSAVPNLPLDLVGRSVLVIPAGALRAEIQVSALADNVLEDPESFRLQLSPARPVTGLPYAPSLVTGRSTLQLFVEDATRGALSLSVSEGVISESGPEPTGSTFRIALSDVELTSGVQIHFNLEGCTIRDCRPPQSFWRTFWPGADRVIEVPFYIWDDGVSEAASRIAMTLVRAETSGLVEIPGPVHVEVKPSNPVSVVVQPVVSEVSEGEEARFAVFLSGGTLREPFSFSYEFLDSADLEAGSRGIRTAEIAVPDRFTEISASVLEDGLNEASETLRLRVYDFGVASPVVESEVLSAVQIAASDPLTVSAALGAGQSASVPEGGRAVFVVSLSSRSASPIRVGWEARMNSGHANTGAGLPDLLPMTSSLSAPAGTRPMDRPSDLAGELVIGAGSSRIQVLVGVHADRMAEGAESFSFSLVSASGGGGASVVGSPIGVTIPASAASARSVLLSGPSSGEEGTAMTFTARLSGDRGFPVETEVSWEIVDAPDGEFQPDSGVLTFPVSASGSADGSQTFVVLPLDDDRNEVRGDYSVRLSMADAAAHGGTSLGADALFSVVASDPVTVSLSGDGSVAEGHSLQVSAALSGGEVAGPFTLNLAVEPGSHLVTADDFAVMAFPIEFAAGARSGSFALQIVDDDQSEGQEFFTVGITGSTAPGPLSGEPLQSYISDRDPVQVSVSAVAAEVSEGEEAVFRIASSVPPAGRVWVEWTARSAVPNAEGIPDFPVEFASGRLSAPGEVRIPVLRDGLAGEGLDEALIFTLTSVASGYGSGQSSLGSPSSVQVSMVEGSSARSVFAVPTSSALREGGTLDFEVVLAGPLMPGDPRGLQVRWELSPAEEFSGPSSGLVSFEDAVVVEGRRSVPVQVRVRRDGVNEGPEPVLLSLALDCPSCAGLPEPVAMPSVDLPLQIEASDPLRASLSRVPGPEGIRSGPLVSGQALHLSVSLDAAPSAPLQVALALEAGGRSRGLPPVLFAPGVSREEFSLSAEFLAQVLSEQDGVSEFRVFISEVAGAPPGAMAGPDPLRGEAGPFVLAGWELHMESASSPGSGSHEAAPEFLSEGEALQVRVSLRGSPAPGDLKLPWQIRGRGSPEASPEDFDGVVQGVLDLSGQDGGLISVRALRDDLEEPDVEAFSLRLDSAFGLHAARVVLDGSGVLSGVLLDAPRSVSVSAAPPASGVFQEGGDLVFSIQMTGARPPGSPVRVPWRLDGPDGLREGVVEFAAGVRLPASQEVRVPVMDDSVNEAQSAHLVEIGPSSDPQDTWIGSASAVLTLSASDPMRLRVVRMPGEPEVMVEGDSMRFMLETGTTTLNGEEVPVIPGGTFVVPVFMTAEGSVAVSPEAQGGLGRSVESVQTEEPAVIRVTVTPESVPGVVFTVPASGSMRMSLGDPEGMPEGMPYVMVREGPSVVVSSYVLSVHPGPVMVREGSVFTVSLQLRGSGSGGRAEPDVSLPWAVTAVPYGISAEAGDFPGGIMPSGMAGLHPSGDPVVLRIPVLDDGVYEGPAPEAFLMTFGPLSGQDALEVRLAEGSSLDPIWVAVPALRAEVSVSVAGPVREGDPLIFTVSLGAFSGSPATASPVEVSFRVEDVTAVAGEDYARPGRALLTIPTGETQVVVHVPTLPDSRLEPEESLRLVLESVSGGGGEMVLSADSSAVGVIRDAAVPSSRRAHRAGVLAAVLDREAVAGALEAISGRLRASGPAAVFPVRSEGAESDPFSDPADVDSESFRDLLGSSSFSSPRSGMGFSAWGGGSHSSLSGDGGGLSYAGRLSSGVLGMDRAFGEGQNRLFGLALGYSSGSLSFADDLEGSPEAGRFERSMAVLYPYAAVRLGSAVDAWVAAGFGRGQSALQEWGHGHARHALGSADSGLWMGAFGAAGSLRPTSRSSLVLDFRAVRVQSRMAQGLFDDGIAMPRVRSRSFQASFGAKFSHAFRFRDDFGVVPFASVRAGLYSLRAGSSFAGHFRDSSLDWQGGLRGAWPSLGLEWQLAYGAQASGGLQSRRFSGHMVLGDPRRSDRSGWSVSGRLPGELSAAYGVRLRSGAGVLAPYAELSGAFGLRWLRSDSEFGLGMEEGGVLRLHGKVRF